MVSWYPPFSYDLIDRLNGLDIFEYRIPEVRGTSGMEHRDATRSPSTLTE
jgi:hypothetical protein